MTKGDCNQPSKSTSDAAAALDAFGDSSSASYSSEFYSPAKHTKPERFDQPCTNVRRFDNSDCTDAAIPSAVLKDFGLIGNNVAKVIDKSKMQQMHQESGQKVRKNKDALVKLLMQSMLIIEKMLL